MSAPEEFLCDGGEVLLTGSKVAEVRANGYALMIVMCAPGCSANHFHLVAEDDDGELVVCTTFDSVDMEGAARTGFLVRALVMMVHGVLDVSLAIPEDEPEEKKDSPRVIPGTPWGIA